MEVKIVTRGSGHSVVAAAAYRTGTKIRDEREGRTHDYSGRTKGVVGSVILRPDNSPEWTASTASLWNAVEHSEKRVDARLAREYVLSIPKELTSKEQWELVVGWAESELVSRGMVAEISLHHPNKRNPHCHILATLRTIDGDKFSAKKPREWNDKSMLLHWRKTWCEAQNAALERAGCSERVSHLSLEAQGVERLPEPKIGKEAVGMKARGVEEDPKKFQAVRETKMLNEVIAMVKAIKTHGEVHQNGVGGNWWEASIHFISRVRERARDAIKSTWQRFVKPRQPELRKDGHEPSI